MTRWLTLAVLTATACGDPNPPGCDEGCDAGGRFDARGVDVGADARFGSDGPLSDEPVPDTNGLDAPDAGPSAPLVSGRGPVVDYYLLEGPAGRSVIVVTRDGVVRLSLATGAVERTLSRPRPILDSVHWGTNLLLTDASSIALFDEDLAAGTAWTESPIERPCVAASVLTDERLLCWRGMRYQHWFLYDLRTGFELNRGEVYVPRHDVEWPYPIPGHDAAIYMGREFVWVPLSMAFSTGPASITGIRVTMDARPADGPIAFWGSPARLILSADGEMLEFGPCLDDSKPFSCTESIDYLATLLRGRRHVATDPLATDSMFVVEGDPDTRCVDDLCHLQRLDIPRGVLAEAPLMLAPGQNLRPVLTATRDRSAVLVVVESECTATGCETWEIREIALPL